MFNESFDRIMGIDVESGTWELIDSPMNNPLLQNLKKKMKFHGFQNSSTRIKETKRIKVGKHS